MGVRSSPGHLEAGFVGLRFRYSDESVRDSDPKGGPVVRRVFCVWGLCSGTLRRLKAKVDGAWRDRLSGVDVPASAHSIGTGQLDAWSDWQG
jgi:hypothetical protein